MTFVTVVFVAVKSLSPFAECCEKDYGRILHGQQFSRVLSRSMGAFSRDYAGRCWVFLAFGAAEARLLTFLGSGSSLIMCQCAIMVCMPAKGG